MIRPVSQPFISPVTKNKSEECETWIDRFTKLENALYLCDLSNTGKVWSLEKYLSLCVLVWKRVPHYFSLFNTYNLYINHVSGSVLRMIKKYEDESDMNHPTPPGYLQFLCVCDPFTFTTWIQPTVQSYFWLKYFSLPDNRLNSKLLSKAKPGSCPPDESLLLQLLLFQDLLPIHNK